MMKMGFEYYSDFFLSEQKQGKVKRTDVETMNYIPKIRTALKIALTEIFVQKYYEKYYKKI